MTEEEWWEADAERLNEMAETARELGVVVKVGKKKDLDSKSEKKITKVFRKLNKKKKSDSK